MAGQVDEDMRVWSMVMLAGSLLPPLAALRPAPDEGVVVAVFAPWTSGAAALLAAAEAGPLAGTGPWRSVVFVANPDGRAPARLFEQGAWLVLSSLRRRFCSV